MGILGVSTIAHVDLMLLRPRTSTDLHAIFRVMISGDSATITFYHCQGVQAYK